MAFVPFDPFTKMAFLPVKDGVKTVYGSMEAQCAQFWCRRPSTELIWTVIYQTFNGYIRSWPGVSYLASGSSKREKRVIFVIPKGSCLGDSFGRTFPNWFSWPNGQLSPKTRHIFWKLCFVRIHLRYLGHFLVDPMRRHNFAGKLHIRSYIIWNCVVTQMKSLVKKCFQ